MSNSENFKKYQENLERYNRGNLRPNLLVDYDRLPLPLLISQLCTEGEILLEMEKLDKKMAQVAPSQSANPVAETARLEKTLGASDKNPYVRARMEVLKKMSDGDRRMIERMEKDGDTENRTYQGFVEKIADLGDSFPA